MRFDSAFADRITALALLCLGAAMTWGGFTMDRLEIRQIHPASIPGLVPMILGAALMVCAVCLALGAEKIERSDDDGGSWPDFAVTAIWSCVFALGLVSRLPFALATTLYVAGFAGWFLLPHLSGAARLRSGALLLAFAALTGIAVSALFRYGFLVRLP